MISPQLKSRLVDGLKRSTRTFLQGAVGVFALTYAKPLFDLARDVASIGPGDQLPVFPDLTFFRNLFLACFSGGVIATVALAQNWLEEIPGVPALLKPKDRSVGDKVLHE